MPRKLALAFLPILAMFVGGCQYYEITDTSTNKTYITNNWEMQDHRWIAGGISFTDLHTGTGVTITQGSEVKPVSSDTAKLDVQGGPPQHEPN